MTNRSGLVCVEENNRLQQRFVSSLLRRLQYSGKFQCLVIFIGMFAPKWARGPHKLARFPSWDSCITPGYWGQYFNALPSSEHCLIHSCPERSYTFVFCPLPSPPLNAYAALLRIRGNYFRPYPAYVSIPRVCHRGAASQWKFSCCLLWQLGLRAVSLFLCSPSSESRETVCRPRFSRFAFSSPRRLRGRAHSPMH